MTDMMEAQHPNIRKDMENINSIIQFRYFFYLTCQKQFKVNL